MQNKSTKIAVWGAGGYMGDLHLKTLIKAGFATECLVGMEIDPSRRNAVSTKHRVPVFATLEEVLANFGVPEFVIVATPSNTHAELIAELYACGVRKFLVEKPLAVRPEEYAAICSLTAEIHVGFLINVAPTLRQVMRYCKANRLTISMVQARWAQNWLLKDRPMGPNVIEEFPHPFVAAVAAIGFDNILDITCDEWSVTTDPYMRPEILAQARLQGLVEDEPNDSTSGRYTVRTKNSGNAVPLIVDSSFTGAEHIRRIAFAFAPEGGNETTQRAELDFDHIGPDGVRYDSIKIYDGTSGVLLLDQVSYEDKLGLQLYEVLNNPDSPLLVSAARAAWLVRKMLPAEKET